MTFEREAWFDIDIFEIREETFSRLPADVQGMIRGYGGAVAVARNGLLLFRAPCSRVDETQRGP